MAALAAPDLVVAEHVTRAPARPGALVVHRVQPGARGRGARTEPAHQARPRATSRARRGAAAGRRRCRRRWRWRPARPGSAPLGARRRRCPGALAPHVLARPVVDRGGGHGARGPRASRRAGLRRWRRRPRSRTAAGRRSRRRGAADHLVPKLAALAIPCRRSLAVVAADLGGPSSSFLRWWW
jgi:hypothetical protein